MSSFLCTCRCIPLEQYSIRSLQNNFHGIWVPNTTFLYIQYNIFFYRFFKFLKKRKYPPPTVQCSALKYSTVQYTVQYSSYVNTCVLCTAVALQRFRTGSVYTTWQYTTRSAVCTLPPGSALACTRFLNNIFYDSFC